MRGVTLTLHRMVVLIVDGANDVLILVLLAITLEAWWIDIVKVYRMLEMTKMSFHLGGVRQRITTS